MKCNAEQDDQQLAWKQRYLVVQLEPLPLLWYHDHVRHVLDMAM